MEAGPFLWKKCGPLSFCTLMSQFWPRGAFHRWREGVSVVVKSTGLPLQMLQLIEDVTHGMAAKVRKVAGRFKRRDYQKALHLTWNCLPF